jgi:hypothetical protein
MSKRCARKRARTMAQSIKPVIALACSKTSSSFRRFRGHWMLRGLSCASLRSLTLCACVIQGGCIDGPALPDSANVRVTMGAREFHIPVALNAHIFPPKPSTLSIDNHRGRYSYRQAPTSPPAPIEGFGVAPRSLAEYSAGSATRPKLPPDINLKASATMNAAQRPPAQASNGGEAFVMMSSRDNGRDVEYRSTRPLILGDAPRGDCTGEFCSVRFGVPEVANFTLTFSLKNYPVHTWEKLFPPFEQLLSQMMRP